MNWMTINMRVVFKGLVAVAGGKLASKWVGKSRRAAVVEAVAAAAVMLAAVKMMAKNRESVANNRLSVVLL